ncbi:MAG: ABC transporter ATP-binding protein [Calditrichaeota bacterium]|nr:MAG: ABC transporter ATP-binding protein [Calditrichota bacterium]
MYKLDVDNLGKRFGERKVFSKISFELKTGDSIAVVGSNGSGKSTLLKVLLSLLVPSRGTVTYSNGEEKLDDNHYRITTSFVSPYLNLYDHLTAEENLKFFTTVAGNTITGKEINNLLAKVGLEGRGVDYVLGYSSGMKQRLKYAVALLKKPEFLFLDEPTSNLDEAGKKIVFDLVEEYRKDTIIIIATNEKEEYELAEKLCRLT